MKEIKLTQNQVALIDDEDFDLVSQYKWFAVKEDNTYYAHSNKWLYGKQVTIRMHRLIMNFPSGKQVDHKNRNGLDNRRENLRVCTHTQNCQNRKARNGVSIFKGVCYESNSRSKKKWRVRINYGKTRIHIGRFLTEEEAAKAYDKAAKKYFGEFANLNFKEE